MHARRIQRMSVVPAAAFLCAGAAALPLGSGFTYQGQIKQAGLPCPGPVDLQVSLWDSATSGTQIGGTQSFGSVALTNGQFTIELNGDGEFGATAFDGNERWLQIDVGYPAGGGTYTPLSRQKMTAAPYALYAPGLWSKTDTGIHYAGGTVGIGTNDPQQALSVVGGINVDFGNLNDGHIIGGPPALYFGRSTGEAIASKRTSGGNQNGLDFYTSFEPRMTITNAGNVGIGTTTPGSKLITVSDIPGSFALGADHTATMSDTPAIMGRHAVTDFYGVGVQGLGGWKGVEGFVSATGSSAYMGVRGCVDGGASGADKRGVSGDVTGPGNNYGVYGTASGGTANWAGYFQGDVFSSGRVQIGAVEPYGYNLMNLQTSYYSTCLQAKASDISQDSTGVRGEATSTYTSFYKYGVFGKATGPGTNFGVYGYASGGTTNYAGYFSGNVYVTGSLSKGGGGFKIDHPLDPANQYLQHSFVESPDMKNIYDGVVTTDADGYATVTLPPYFEALNRDFRYQLTCIGQFAQAMVAREVENNRFTIQTDKPGVKVSWQVTGIRKDAWADANRIEVEMPKQESDRGMYLHPELYGAPAEQQIARARQAEENGPGSMEPVGPPSEPSNIKLAPSPANPVQEELPS